MEGLDSHCGDSCQLSGHRPGLLFLLWWSSNTSVECTNFIFYGWWPSILVSPWSIPWGIDDVMRTGPGVSVQVTDDKSTAPLPSETFKFHPLHYWGKFYILISMNACFHWTQVLSTNQVNCWNHVCMYKVMHCTSTISGRIASLNLFDLIQLYKKQYIIGNWLNRYLRNWKGKGKQ